jgi:hypothetical protein
MDLYAITNWLEVPKRDGAMSFIGLMTKVVVAQKLRGLNAFECK